MVSVLNPKNTIAKQRDVINLNLARHLKVDT